MTQYCQKCQKCLTEKNSIVLWYIFFFSIRNLSRSILRSLVIAVAMSGNRCPTTQQITLPNPGRFHYIYIFRKKTQIVWHRLLKGYFFPSTQYNVFQRFIDNLWRAEAGTFSFKSAPLSIPVNIWHRWLSRDLLI